MFLTGGSVVSTDTVAAMHHRVQRRLAVPITNILYESTSNLVNAAVNVKITVTLASGVGPNQALRFTFPSTGPSTALHSVILPASATVPTLVATDIQPVGSMTVSRSGLVITVQHSPGGGVSALTVYVTLGGFTNPPVAGAVNALVYVEKLLSGGSLQADSATNPAGWMIQPGVLTLAAGGYASYTGEQKANLPVQASLSFTKQSDFVADGYFIVEFSKGSALDLVGTPTTTLLTMVPSPTPLTVLNVTTPSPTTIKMALKNNGGSTIPSAPTAAPITFAVDGFSNPNRVGAVSALVSLSMYSDLDYLVDQAATPMVVGWNVIGPTAITSVSWLGSSSAALATGVSVSITFTIAQDLPNTGAFIVEFPITLGGVNDATVPAMASLLPAAVVVSTNVDIGSFNTPTSSIGPTSNTVRITRDGSGSTIAAGTQLKLTLNGFTNPNRVGAVTPLVSLKAVSGVGDTNVDAAAALPTTGWSVVAPAALTPVTWALVAAPPASVAANTVTSFTVTFTVATDWPNNAQLWLDFTNAASRHALVVPTAAASITASIASPAATFVSPVTVSGQVLKLVRNNGATITAGTAVTVSIAGLVNPNALGPVDAMTSLKTYNSAGTDLIDEAQTLPTGTWSVIGPLSITAALTAANTVASATPVSVTVSFNIAQPLADVAKIVVVFGGLAVPTGIHDIDVLTAPTLSSTGVSGAGAYGAFGTLTVSASDQTVTFVRNGGGAVVPEPTTATTPVTVSLTFCCVTNPNRIGPTTALASVSTYATSADTTAVEATQGTQPAGYPVTGPTVMTGYTWAPKTPTTSSGSDDVAAHTTSIVLQFTIFTDWPAGGTIVLSFPTLGFGNRMYLTVPASGVAGTLTIPALARTEPLTGTSVGQTLTLRRPNTVVSATETAGIAVQIEITGFTNPNTVSESLANSEKIAALLGLETRTSVGATLDTVVSTYFSTAAALGWYLVAPAVLTGVSLQSNTNAAMAPVRVIIQFTIASDLPADAKIIITFPNPTGDPHALQMPAAVTLDAFSLTMTGTFSLSYSAAARTVTLARINDPFGTAAANFESPAALEIQLAGFTNPNAVGAVTALAGLRTVQSNGVTAIDIASTLSVGWVIVAPAVLTAVSYDSVIKTADAPIQIIFKFTVATALPVTSKIVIVFPVAGLHAASLTAGATVVAAGSGTNFLPGTLTVATDTTLPQLKITVTGNGAVSANTAVQFTLSTSSGDFLNPPSLNAVDPLVALQTQDSAGVVLDEYNAALAPMITWSIEPGTLNLLTVVASSIVAGAPTDLTFQFSMTRVIPATGDIYITFPDTSLSSRLAVVLPASVTVGTLSGITGTLTPVCSGQILTLTRSGGSFINPLNGPISFTLSGFASPNVAGGLTDAFVAIQTRDSTAQIIDQAAASTLTDVPVLAPPAPTARWYLDYPGNLYDVTLTSNTSTYLRPVAVQLDFSIATALPAAGSIGIVFPAVTVPTSSLTVPATVTVQSTSLDGTLTASVSGQTVLLARSGGTTLAAPTMAAVPVRVSVTLSGFVNPSVNNTLVPALLSLETYSTVVAASDVATATSAPSLLDRALTLLPGWRVWVPTLPVLLHTENFELLYAYYFGADPTGTFYPLPDHPPKHVTRDTLVRALTGGGLVTDAIIQSAQMQVVRVNGTTDLGTLWYTDMYSIVGTWNAATSTLNLVGDAPAILYQLAILSVTYDCPTSLHISDVPDLHYQQVCYSATLNGTASQPLNCRDITLRAARRVYTDDRTGHIMNYQAGPQPLVI
jgi:hypothetical protein